MPLFFVHIPKTAGTSFRLGAEQAFGKPHIVYDYGKAAPETSDPVQKWLYRQRPDCWAFGEAIRQRQAAMVAGHVNAGRFVSLFGVTQTLSFLREPLQRMASEYAHFMRHHDYKGSFRDFYSRPVMHNRQSKILQGVDVEAVGLLGLTERYAESLAMLNARYEVDIPPREDVDRDAGRAGLPRAAAVAVRHQCREARVTILPPAAGRGRGPRLVLLGTER